MYQLTCLYPDRFEFNDLLLAVIGMHAYAGRFGDTLDRSEGLRRGRGTTRRIASVWQPIL